METAKPRIGIRIIAAIGMAFTVLGLAGLVLTYIFRGPFIRMLALDPASFGDIRNPLYAVVPFISTALAILATVLAFVWIVKAKKAGKCVWSALIIILIMPLFNLIGQAFAMRIISSYGVERLVTYSLMRSIYGYAGHLTGLGCALSLIAIGAYIFEDKQLHGRNKGARATSLIAFIVTVLALFACIGSTVLFAVRNGLGGVSADIYIELILIVVAALLIMLGALGGHKAPAIIGAVLLVIFLPLCALIAPAFMQMAATQAPELYQKYVTSMSYVLNGYCTELAEFAGKLGLLCVGAVMVRR